MKKSIYRFLIINCGISIIIMINLAYYMVGIIDKSVAINLVNKEFSKIENSIDNSNQEIENIVDQVSNDTIAKAKAFAIMLNQSPGVYLDYEAIEEVRVALNADEIIVTNKNGIVVAGTTPFIGQNFNNSDIEKQFVPAIEDKSFSKVVNINNDGELSQYAGVARLDESGIILVESTADKLSQTIKLAGISTVLSRSCIMKTGEMAIVNNNTWKYVSHSDENYVGETSQISKMKFKNIETTGQGNFKMKIKDINFHVFYKVYKENVLIAQIPLKEMYYRRNYVIVSFIIALPILVLVSILAVRKKLIDNYVE